MNSHDVYTLMTFTRKTCIFQKILCVLLDKVWYTVILVINAVFKECELCEVLCKCNIKNSNVLITQYFNAHTFVRKVFLLTHTIVSTCQVAYTAYQSSNNWSVQVCPKAVPANEQRNRLE